MITPRFTQNQPEHWNRHKIGECFSIMSPAMGSSNPLTAEVGDVIIVATRDKLSARLATMEEDITGANKGLLRAKGLMKPELIVMLLSNKSFSKELINAALDNSFIGLVRVRDLRDVVVAVPDPPTQVMMAKAYEEGVGWMYAHANCLRQQSTLLDQMGDGIAHQILLGKADRKQTFTWIRDAMDTLFKAHGNDNEVDYLTSDQVQQASPEVHYVSQQQHQARVNALIARVKELEQQTGIEATLPALRSPRP